MSDTAVYRHFNPSVPFNPPAKKLHCMYDAWDSWALAAPLFPRKPDPIVITMVTAQQATLSVYSEC